MNILENEDIRNWNRLYSCWKTYPQVWIDKKFVGGVDKIKELIKNDEFEKLLPKDMETAEEKKSRIIKRYPCLIVIQKD